MIDRFTWDEIRQLARVEDPAAVTLLMPTYESGREVRQNAVRFKNLLHRAGELLKERGVSAADRDARLSEGEKAIHDESWWQHQGSGLAWMVAGEGCHRYRLPIELPEGVFIGEQFHLRPLVPIPQHDGGFFLLAVSQNRVRLFRGNRFAMERLEPEDLPSDLLSALNIDEYVESLQQHSTAPRNVSGGMMFHGQGGAGMDVQKRDEILPFFRRIDEAFRSHFGEEHRPLVFAGVDFLFPLYKEAADYRHLVSRSVEGNPDDARPDDLQRRALEVLRPIFDKPLREAIEAYHDSVGRREAGHDPAAILQAARDGLVETLLLGEQATSWGRFDEGAQSWEVTDEAAGDSQDLGNLAAVRTLRTGGQVLVCPSTEMPEGHPLVAVYRAPVPAFE